MSQGNLIIPHPGERKRTWKRWRRLQSTASIEWLKSHGHTSDEIVDCIEYITGDKKKGAE